MRVFVLERVIPLLVIHVCKQSVHHVSRTKYLWSIVSIGRQCPVKSILGIFLFLIVHGPGAKPSYKNKKKLSMDLVHDRGSMDTVHESGPWTRSKEGVHGPPVHVLSSPRSAISNRFAWYLICTPIAQVKSSSVQNFFRTPSCKWGFILIWLSIRRISFRNSSLLRVVWRCLDNSASYDPINK